MTLDHIEVSGAYLKVACCGGGHDGPPFSAKAPEHGDRLDERDARRPLIRAELHSQAEEIAARVVASGGGMQAVLEATGFRTLENVVRGIDAAILVQALDNDLLAQAKPPPLDR